MLRNLLLTVQCKFEVNYFLLLRRAYTLYDDLDARRLEKQRQRSMGPFNF